MPPKKPKQETYVFPKNFLDLSKKFSKQYYKPLPSTVISGQIIVVENFISSGICDELVKSFEAKLQLETTPLIKSKIYATRVNDRCSLMDLDTAGSLWEYLHQVINQELSYEDEDMEEIQEEFHNAIGLNPQLRIYRYKEGHHFNQHYDESVECSPRKGILGKTGWTLLVYLTGDEEFQGGSTIFYPDHNGGLKGLKVIPKKGMALLHKHGDDCLLHEGEKVKKGEKWIFRSDVVFPN